MHRTLPQALILALLWVYRTFITRFTPACPEREACSEYAVRMVREHGATVGLELALIKVQNCGKEATMRRHPDKWPVS